MFVPGWFEVRVGSDPNGVLVIGCTGDMNRRWNQSCTAREKCYGSSTLNLLYYLDHYTPLLQLHPTAVYEYRFAVAESPEKAKECIVDPENWTAG